MLLFTTSNTLCYGCVFVLMLGAFFIGYFAPYFKLKKRETKDKNDSLIEASERLKPLGVIKTMNRSGNKVEKEA